MSTPINGTVAGLIDLVDWPVVMSQSRCAGGHEDVLLNIFGPTSLVIAWWSEDDYQGTVAIATLLQDGRIVVMTDYYGSCSGCDGWDCATDEDARKMITDLVNSAKVFDNALDAKEWCANVDSVKEPQFYPFESAKHLVWRV